MEKEYKDIELSKMMMLMFASNVRQATMDEMDLKDGDVYSLTEYRHRLEHTGAFGYAPDPDTPFKIGKLAARMSTLVTKEHNYIGVEIEDTDFSLLTHVYHKADIRNISAYIAPFMYAHRDRETDQKRLDETINAIRYNQSTLIDATGYWEHVGGMYGFSWLFLTDDETEDQVVANTTRIADRMTYVSNWLTQFLYDVESMWMSHDCMHYMAGDYKINTIGDIDHG